MVVIPFILFLAVVCFLAKYPIMLVIMGCVFGVSLLSIMAAVALGADASILFGYTG